MSIAFLDQYNIYEAEPIFDPEDILLVRYLSYSILIIIIIVSSNFIQIFFRLQVIKLLRAQWKSGNLDSEWFAADQNADMSGRGETPDQYLQRMAKPGVFQDSLFLAGLSHLLGHDIILLAVHEASVPNGLYTRISGGGDRIGSGVSCQNCPLFIGKIF